ncbi:glycosyl hydrolase family 28-related protein [Bacillus sp. EAC]|uniref:glycosyl hydrolase family 28-related protein n=1 Tax=Bacillus sp. EAC TaxID=1978338 RepID=UPI000B434760|nr:glycosyl hydrolase family 28-related protein [Bacillus sp. EAC]
MSSKKTSNLKMNYWVETDNFSLREIVENFVKIDNEFGDRGINVKWFGAKGDGITDDTEAINKAISSVSPSKGGSVFFPFGYYKVTEIKLTSKDVHLFGNGTILDGCIVVGDQKNVNDLDFRIEGLTFRRYSISKNKNAIELQNARKGRIYNCTFFNYDKCIYVRPKPIEQHTSRVLISNNVFHSANYCLYIDSDNFFQSGRYYSIGDFQFINNQADSGINYSHIYGKGVDGLIVKGNTFFFSSHTSKNQTKLNNINIDFGNFVNIIGNNLFEAGTEAIILKRINNFLISNNNIPWSGQRVPSPAISIQKGDIFEKTNEMIGNISNNTIQNPSMTGIHIGSGTANINISCNIITQVGQADHYYGNNSLSSIKKYAIKVDESSKNIYVNNNHAPNSIYSLEGDCTSTNNIDKNGLNTINNVTKTITDNPNFIEVDGLNQFNLYPTETMEIKGFSDTFSGNEVTIIAFNNNVKIKNSSELILKNFTNTSLPKFGLIKFRFTTGKWFEVSRNY